MHEDKTSFPGDLQSARGSSRPFSKFACSISKSWTRHRIGYNRCMIKCTRHADNNVHAYVGVMFRKLRRDGEKLRRYSKSAPQTCHKKLREVFVAKPLSHSDINRFQKSFTHVVFVCNGTRKLPVPMKISNFEK